MLPSAALLAVHPERNAHHRARRLLPTGPLPLLGRRNGGHCPLLDVGALLPRCPLLDVGPLLPRCPLLDVGALLPRCPLLDVGALLPRCPLLDVGALLP